MIYSYWLLNVFMFWRLIICLEQNRARFDKVKINSRFCIGKCRIHIHLSKNHSPPTVPYCLGHFLVLVTTASFTHFQRHRGSDEGFFDCVKYNACVRVCMHLCSEWVEANARGQAPLSFLNNHFTGTDNLSVRKKYATE